MLFQSVWINTVNINPHAIRRGYAKDLLNKGANLALIPKALGRSILAVTTQYLDLDENEVVTNLRAFLWSVFNVIQPTLSKTDVRS